MHNNSRLFERESLFTLPIIREFKGVKPQEETEALYSFKEYSQGSFTKKYEIRFNDDYDFVMVANGRSYLMVLEAPFIRAQE